MSNFVSSSIGKKFFMSITGFFLMMFLLVHLSINLLLIFDDSGELFNMGAHFMGTNPLIRIVEPILAIGFILHMAYAVYLTWQNMKARPVDYKQVNQKEASTWASRNMFVLGLLITSFLVLHIMNFYWKLKIEKSVGLVMVSGAEMHDAYTLVAGLFKSSLAYDLVYIFGAIVLGIHLTHGFWSAFQTMGWSGNLWRKRIEFVGNVFAIIIAIGFSIIPLYFIIRF
ncbi:MAG TPA: succinate dehydrogenase [Marinilabiliales bacterium]|nr:MAG: succinate dehydrogenase [Bacteroidetes bacterium GWA2_40_14]OFX57192.1 MAG: succinate dehydrogenase [Bacteroidetes bacterium GWC2_40_13]OFX72294.1 MAG: succinate dehydrogenase [Bacteroidetes bacterium GWD2_40_43]OFX90458.1 MAG: succinate dehydrogenase [Bacteroidetes bacterium GWE2_40_63]OFY17296.1 MAG: succinate dehydrogenase [Bacteroidetes bacterium GWF2_40_13]OFZ29126.1 MAG: succinate dehydrogenase [Bacteroidetes bacterium RIFOXYC2_FULL_40_12]HAN00863.1 succinate dehydrogenase [Mari